MTESSRARVRLVLLTNEREQPGQLRAIVRACRLARPGGIVVLLRDKELPIRQRMSLGEILRGETRAAGQLLVVADRIDLGLFLEADGIHLPTDGVLPGRARELGPWRWISRAHHRLERLPRAELQHLTHVLVSPALEARKGRAALGLVGLAARAAELRMLSPALRICALGGVTSEACEGLLAGGLDAVCVMGGLVRPGEPERLVRGLGLSLAD